MSHQHEYNANNYNPMISTNQKNSNKINTTGSNTNNNAACVSPNSGFHSPAISTKPMMHSQSFYQSDGTGARVPTEFKPDIVWEKIKEYHEVPLKTLGDSKYFNFLYECLTLCIIFAKNKHLFSFLTKEDIHLFYKFQNKIFMQLTTRRPTEFSTKEQINKLCTLLTENVNVLSQRQQKFISGMLLNHNANYHHVHRTINWDATRENGGLTLNELKDGEGSTIKYFLNFNIYNAEKSGIFLDEEKIRNLAAQIKIPPVEVHCIFNVNSGSHGFMGHYPPFRSRFGNDFMSKRRKKNKRRGRFGDTMNSNNSNLGVGSGCGPSTVYGSGGVVSDDGNLSGGGGLVKGDNEYMLAPGTPNSGMNMLYASHNAPMREEKYPYA